MPHPLESFLTRLRDNHYARNVFIEIFGSDLPHFVMVQSRNESIDQMIGQSSNWLNMAMVTPLLNKGIDHLQTWLNKGVPIAQAGADYRQWSHLAKESLLYGNLLGFGVALPGLRNAVMMRRTGTINFVDMVGVNKGVQEDPAQVKAEADKNLKAFGGFMG